MSSAADRLGGRSIAWPIFALVLASVLVANAVLFAVTFSGPPPHEGDRGVDPVALALRTGRLPEQRGFSMIVREQATAPAAPAGLHPDPSAVIRLATALGEPEANVVAFTGGPPGEIGPPFGGFLVGWRHDGRWRVAENGPLPFLTHWHWMTLAAILAAVLALSLPAWLIARAISRPLRRLAAAAGQARAGAPLGSLPHGGSREVRALSAAVAAMHGRLAGHAESRTAMLGAIAHDLGTPLSRLAFRIEQLPDEARQRAAGDIDDMRAMIAATLVFARDETGPLVTQRIDLGSLIESLGADMQDAGAPVSVEVGPRAVVRGDASALRRLFANLAENAVRYGDRADLTWRIAGEGVEVAIDDAGPGIDPAEAEHLFDPFVRGERSRNRATGGTGLGLAIARSVASRHGGSVRLENAARGARATVTLPLA